VVYLHIHRKIGWGGVFRLFDEIWCKALETWEIWEWVFGFGWCKSLLFSGTIDILKTVKLIVCRPLQFVRGMSKSPPFALHKRDQPSANSDDMPIVSFGLFQIRLYSDPEIEGEAARNAKISLFQAV
jgi:hypothetical protein